MNDSSNRDVELFTATVELSADERDEYERYIQANFLIGALQRQAKRVLANGAHS